MQTSNSWPRFEEPFRRTLVRNGILAALAGTVVALLRHDLTMLLPLAVLALWPSLGGHYVELAFLNGLRARIPPGRVTQTLARLLVWFGGGVLLFLCMTTTARALAITVPLPRLWWYGGVLFIGIELVVHGTLALRKQPNFYNGRG